MTTARDQPVRDNRYCFVCGERNPLGLKSRPETDVDQRSACLRLVIPEEFQGWEGMVHGGVIAALLDEVAAYAGMTQARHIVTAELATRYLKPVPVGVEVFVEARVREQQRRSLFIDAQLACGGVVMARAEARMVVLRSETIP